MSKSKKQQPHKEAQANITKKVATSVGVVAAIASIPLPAYLDLQHTISVHLAQAYGLTRSSQYSWLAFLLSTIPILVSALLIAFGISYSRKTAKISPVLFVFVLISAYILGALLYVVARLALAPW